MAGCINPLQVIDNNHKRVLASRRKAEFDHQVVQSLTPLLSREQAGQIGVR